MNQMKEQVRREELESMLQSLPPKYSAAVVVKRLIESHLALLDLQDKRRDAIAEALGCLSVIAKGEHKAVAKDLAAIGIAEIHKLSMGENITPRQALLDECDSLRKRLADAERSVEILSDTETVQAIASGVADMNAGRVKLLDCVEGGCLRANTLEHIDALRKDKARLDWLESLKAPSISQFGNGWWQLFEKGVQYKAAFLREALDQAMKVRAARERK